MTIPCTPQAELAEQREAAAAAEGRAEAAARESAQLRAELEAARALAPQRQSADEAPHAAANGHAENGAMSAEEQVMDYRCCIHCIVHDFCSSLHLYHCSFARSAGPLWPRSRMAISLAAYPHASLWLGGTLHRQQRIGRLSKWIRAPKFALLDSTDGMS